MATSTGAPWNLPSPLAPDAPDGPANMGDLADSVHAALGRAYPCVSGARPSPVEGMLIFETDTDTLQVSLDGSTWTPLWYPAVWTTPASPYSNSWVAYGGGLPSLAYRKTPDGFVHLRGMVKSGTVATIYTLPTGYRPPAAVNFIGVAGGYGAARIQVNPTGTVDLVSYVSPGNNTYVALDHIQFDTAT